MTEIPSTFTERTNSRGRNMKKVNIRSVSNPSSETKPYPCLYTVKVNNLKCAKSYKCRWDEQSCGIHSIPSWK